jgi:hypothetical protein
VTKVEVEIVDVDSETEDEDDVDELKGEVVGAFGVRNSTPPTAAIAITTTTTNMVASRAMPNLLLFAGSIRDYIDLD